MNRDLSLLLDSLIAARALLRGVRRYGIERDRALAIIDRAESEGREPSIDDVRAELGDLAGELDELEAKINQHDPS